MDNTKKGNSVKGRNSPLDILKRILIFVLLVGGTMVLLRPLQLSLYKHMERIRDDFIIRFENFFGRKLQYASMGPSIFGMLDVRNVLVLREDYSVLLSISRLRLSYSIIELIRGDVQDAFHSVRIDHPVLSFDFDKDRDLAERFSFFRERGISAPGRNGDQDFFDFLPENFSFRILNGEWGISGTKGALSLKGVRLEASVRQNRIAFQGHWEAAASLAVGDKPSFLLSSLTKTDQNKEISPLLRAVMSGRINGEYSSEKEEGSAVIYVSSLSGDYFSVKPLTLGCFLSGGILEIRKTHDKSPAAISLVYDLGNGKLSGSFEAENFSAEELFVFTGELGVYNPVLAMKITGHADLEIESPRYLSYNVGFSGLMPNSGFGPAALEIMAQGDGEHVKIDLLGLRSSYGDLVFRGGIDFINADFKNEGILPIAPFGLLSFSDLRLHGTAGITGSLAINTSGREINIHGENFSAGNSVIPAFEMSLYQEQQGINFFVYAGEVINSEKPRSILDGERNGGSISLDGSVDYDPGHIRASLNLDSFSSGDLLNFSAPFAPLPALPGLVRSAAGDLSITTELFFTTDYEHILYNAPLFMAVYKGLGAEILAEASLSGTDRRFELSEGAITWDKGSADISCSLDFSDPDDIAFSFGAAYRDLTYFFEGMILDRKNISVIGSYGFQVFLSADDSGAYSGYAQGDNIPIPSGENNAALDFLLSLYFVSPSFWEAGIERFEVSGLTTPDKSPASLSIMGTANDRGLVIPSLTYDDGKGPLGGSVSLNWDTSYSSYRFKADIIGSNRNEYYGLLGTYGDSKLELYLSGLGMQFSRISTHNAIADGSLRLSWESLSSFEAETVLSSFTYLRPNGEIRLSAQAGINSDSLQLSQLKLVFSGLEANVPYLRINRTETHAETAAFISGSAAGSPVDISFSGEADFSSSETWIDLLKGTGLFDGSLVFERARYDTIEAGEPFSFSFSGERKEEVFAFNLSGGPKNMIRLRYSSEGKEGSFYAAISSPSPVRGSFAGSIDSKNIDARTTDLYVDLTSLWRFVPPTVDEVKFPAGIVTGSVRIAGPLGDPEFYGTAKGTSVHILVPNYITEPIRPIPTTFTLSGTEMAFGPVDAIVGQGAGKASGLFKFEKWIPNVFTIDIQVPMESPIPYGLDISGIMAKGLVGGKLLLAMEDMVLTIEGDLTADTTEISLNANEMALFETNPGALYKETIVSSLADITIRSGRRVEFFWPSADFPMLQANADMGSAIRITSDYAARRFTVTGDVRLRGGELFYLERNFYLREGTLFLNENETQVDPRISARAEIRDRTEDGPVTISLIIDNAPLRSFTARFESSPPLSQMEIYSLLGQNPQGMAGTNQQRNLATSAVFDTLTQFTVIRRLQRQIRDFLGLDMLSVRTQVLQNVVLQVTSGQILNVTDGTSRVGNYFDNSTVYIGKYFASDMFGEAMLSFKYDENKANWGGLRLEPEIGLEMRNPLFDIRFSIVPLHPENYFINDVSFSLIWRRSF